MLQLALTLLSAGAFVYYGCSTLITDGSRHEYERLGVTPLRVFVGLMQLLGAAGLLLGLRFTVIGTMASVGFVLLMCIGLVIRYRSGDWSRLMAPAAVLGVTNVILFTQYVF